MLDINEPYIPDDEMDQDKPVIVISKEDAGDNSPSQPNRSA